MNEELNEGSIGNRVLKGQLLDAQLASSAVAKTKHKKNQLELLITEEELFVWDMLAKGRTQAQVAKELGVARATVIKRINAALEKVRGWAGKEAEDWRNAQLLIVGDQISGIIDDTMAQPIPRCSPSGDQLTTHNGYPIWDISPQEAAKQRNMARVTLQKYLDHQAKLLNLTVERKEIQVEQKTAIAVYNFGTFDGAVSLDDL